MKNFIFTLLFLFLFATGFSQKVIFDLSNTRSIALKKEKLTDPKVISDIIPQYPSSWIIGVISTEVQATCGGRIVKASGTSEILTMDQRNIIQTADLGSALIVNINYTCRNGVTDEIERSTIRFKATVAPEVEAEYPGGSEQMTKYLTENTFNKISKTSPDLFRGVIVKFTINENGEIGNAKISRSSSDPKLDELLLETINKMPKWKPAENSSGTKVKEEFELSVGSVGEGC